MKPHNDNSSRAKKLLIQIEKIKKLKAVQTSDYLEELDTLRERLNDKIFRVVVVGEFSSGKSTFINAIIGRDVLKHAATETTATVTYIYNVAKEDRRLNSCEIEFNDGKKVYLADLDKLIEYTTVNSEINVADSIKSVSLYINFLNVNYPIVIADTPGLNGIADRHREITLDEIKKAHACIYLLSSNGVKSTDLDFIKVLLHYQKRFIFVQNFIDLLRVSEGETINAKIAKDKENLNICFGDNDSDIDCQIYGISAAKALAAKDTSKEKVFEEDLDVITDRTQLFDESNFSEFEKGLFRIVESGEYLDVIEDAVAYTLLQIIGRIKNNLDDECELNEQLKAKDDKSFNIEKARKIIARLEAQKEDNVKRLKNFLISRDSENRHSLHEYAKRRLEELLATLNADLDEKAKTYEEFVTFASYYGNEPPLYYGKYISNYVNGQLIPDVDNRIQDNLSHLYEEAILRVSNFTLTEPVVKDNINIEIINQIEHFSEKEIQSNLEKYQIEAQTKKSCITMMKNSIKDMNRKKDSVEYEINSAMRQRSRDRQQYEMDKKMLGNNPGVKEKSVQRERTVARKGLFKGLRDWIFGEKTETYWETVPDYSEQNEWKKRMANLEEKNRRIQGSHNQRMSLLDSQKKKIQDTIQSNSKMIERLQDDVRDLENRARREQEIYEKTLKANKQEYCDNEKRKLKEEFLKVIIYSEERTSTLERIYEHIDSSDLKYLPKIQDMALKYYFGSVRARIDGLSEMIQSNEAELDAKYELSKKERHVLEEAINLIKEG